VKDVAKGFRMEKLHDKMLLKHTKYEYDVHFLYFLKTPTVLKKNKKAKKSKEIVFDIYRLIKSIILIQKQTGR
jgi:hypothetical protein